MIHKLKILPEYFKAVKSGAKKFECRLNDRDYKVGDQLLLQEWDCGFTGESILSEIAYILDDNQYTQPDYVIMSIEVIK